MIKNINLCWGISNYSGLPNRKRKLLTKEFLADFKDEIIRLDRMYIEPTEIFKDINCEEFMFYNLLEGSELWYRALKNICKKHNLIKALYEYAKNTEQVNDDIILEMINKNIIKKIPNYKNEMKSNSQDKFQIKLIKKYKGYNVFEYLYNYPSWCNDKEEFHKIFNMLGYEITYLN